MPFITILHVLHLSSMLPHNISHTSAFWDGACKRGLNGTEPHKTPGNRRKWVNEDSKRCRSWRPLAVQEMCVCVSRPRWCEAIFRENPKTRKREAIFSVFWFSRFSGFLGFLGFLVFSFPCISSFWPRRADFLLSWPSVVTFCYMLAPF